VARGDDDLGLPPDEPPTDEQGRHIIKLPGVRVNVVNATIAALARLELFQRGGGLVDIVRDPENGEGNVVLPSGEPRVRITPYTRVHELCTLACRFEARRKNKETGEFFPVEVDPPDRVVRTVMERGEWAHIRPLDSMVSWPVLRPDGSIFDGLGYDARTKCYATKCVGLDLRPCITPQDVAAAIATIDDLLCDFPFERPAHKSAWLSALLSVLARPAIRGPIPMLIVDANDRGSGKTLLCDTIGAILTGSKLPRRGIPESEEEWGKVLLGIGIGCYPVVLLDNVTATLRSAKLDMVLTGEVYQDRVLGVNVEMKVPVKTQFIASCNNAAVSTDLIRRSMHCRIVVDEERPEQRSGFRYTLPDDACEPAMRKRLLEAAFTILIGYEQAGRPKTVARTLGSYESWSARIQSAIVWAGLPDPAETQDELREQADNETEQLGPLLEAWRAMYGDRAVTASDALRDAREQSSSEYDSPNPAAVALLAAFDALAFAGKRVTAQTIGSRIKGWKNKWLNSLSFMPGPEAGGSRKWWVRARSG
jgi:hypothetical protein